MKDKGILILTNILDHVLYENTLRQYAWFLGVIIFIVIFNKFISNLINKVLFTLLKRTRFKHRGKLFLELMLQPIEFFLVLHALYFGFHTLHAPKFFTEQFAQFTIQGLLYGFYRFFLILIIAWIFSRLSDFVIRVMRERAEETPDPTDDQLVAFLKDLFKVVIWTTAMLCMLGIVFHVNITSLVAGAGIAGIAIAFAAQESLQNIFGSISIFTEKPFVIGDYVIVDGVEGTVEKVGFRSTRVRNLDKSFVTIPNKNIVNNHIINLSRRTSRRVKFLLCVEYGTSKETISAICKEIEEYLNAHARMNEKSMARFHQFGPSSLDIWVDYYVEYLDWDDFLSIREEVMFRIMEIVQSKGASFAFPSQTVYLRNEE